MCEMSFAQVAGIEFTHFGSKDVVRHPLVQKIVDAYESYQDDDRGRQNDDRRGNGRR